jgi:hypothetical protein
MEARQYGTALACPPPRRPRRVHSFCPGLIGHARGPSALLPRGLGRSPVSATTLYGAIGHEPSITPSGPDSASRP